MYPVHLHLHRVSEKPDDANSTRHTNTRQSKLFQRHSVRLSFLGGEGSISVRPVALGWRSHPDLRLHRKGGHRIRDLLLRRLLGRKPDLTDDQRAEAASKRRVC